MNYEYKTLSFNEGGCLAIDNTVNRLAKDGWEPILMSSKQSLIHIMFRREKISSPEMKKVGWPLSAVGAMQ